jgi:hypothetical protein
MIAAAALELVLLVGVAVCGVLVARWQGFDGPRIFLDVVGIVLGGVLGSIPGVFVLIGHTVTVATGSSAGSWFIPDLVLFAVLGIGALAGLSLADRLSRQGRRKAASWKMRLGAAGGFGLACLVVSSGVLVGQQTPLELPIMIAVPLATIGLALGGFSVFQPRQSNRSG